MQKTAPPQNDQCQARSDQENKRAAAAGFGESSSPLQAMITGSALSARQHGFNTLADTSKTVAAQRKLTGRIQQTDSRATAGSPGLPVNPVQTSFAEAHFPLLQQHADGIVQPVWKTMGPKELKWDRVMGGLQWFYHRIDDTFSYHIIVDLDVPMEMWEVVERHESDHLTEEELDSLGIGEMDFEEGDDRVVYEAPEPRFAPVDVSMVTRMGEKELVDKLTKHLAHQTESTNYDRLAYINAFLLYAETKPNLSLDEALANFNMPASEAVWSMGGGHCGGLSEAILREVNYGPGAYLAASILPSNMQQKGAPTYCHVAAMIRFQSPETAEDAGLILLEPGFNITTPIVVKKGRTTDIQYSESEIWGFSLNEDQSMVICQPRPKKESEKWKSSKAKEKRMLYRTDVFLNPDMSLTAPLLWMDGRPPILARDERGNVVGQIVLNYAKSQLEIKLGDTRDAIPFAQILKDGAEGKDFLGKHSETLAARLRMAPDRLLRRIFVAVKNNWKQEK